jgi:ketosteroid isomerase-like protein
MQTSKRELLLAAYAAFNRRDIEAVLTLMSPDVDWPNGMEGGRVLGHDQVRSYWRRQWAVLDPHVEPVEINEDESGSAVVRVHQVVRDLGGTVLVNQFVGHVYSFRDGLIDRMEIQPTTDSTSESIGRQGGMNP